MGFTLPQLNSSCCGCHLRTGTLIILWICLVVGILMIGVPPLAQQGPSSNSTTPSGPTPVTPSTNVPPIPPLTVVDVVVNVIFILVSSVGLYGTYKEVHVYLLPYLIWEAVYTLQNIARTIIAEFTLGVILAELLVFLFGFYFWLVVYSHYRVLKGSTRPIQA